MRVLLVGSIVLACLIAGMPQAGAGLLTGQGRSQATPRILYSSDWSGTSQIYTVDPSKSRKTAQLTFGRAPVCAPGAPCGYSSPVVSPDGRRFLFTDFRLQGPLDAHLFVARLDGRSRRRLATLGPSRYGISPADWAPDSRHIAYTGSDGIHVVGADGSGDRLVPTSAAGDYRPA